MKFNKTKNIGQSVSKKGFTMIEILMVTAIMMLMVAIGFGAHFRFYAHAYINTDVDNVTTNIKQARFQAIKNADNSDYGVHFDDTAHTLTTFKGSYNPSAPSNVTLGLEQLEITDLSLMPNLGVTNEILFENPNGKTQNTGSFTVGSGSENFTFNINLQGIID